MSEDVLARRFQQIKQALLAVYGVVVSLLVVVLFGDLYSFYAELPAGWFTLWLLTTIASIPMGIFLLVGRTSKSIPLTERRGPALAYLMAGFVNFFSLALFTSYQNEPVFFCVPGAYAFTLFLIYARVYTIADRVRDETFP
ncbi:MAG: hypothetical protein AB1449_03240 [Chloroflexota bacterium]